MSNDPAETDPAALSSSESLDEDELRVDPLEEGVEPPEHWSAADRDTTPARQQEGEHVDERLAEEQPDFGASTAAEPARPTAQTPEAELDESVDYTGETSEPLVSEQPLHMPEYPQSGQSQNADQAGGSVADEIREPER